MMVARSRHFEMVKIWWFLAPRPREKERAVEVLHASKNATAPKLLKSADAFAASIDIHGLRLQPNPRELLNAKAIRGIYKAAGQGSLYSWRESGPCLATTWRTLSSLRDGVHEFSPELAVAGECLEHHESEQIVEGNGQEADP